MVLEKVFTQSDVVNSKDPSKSQELNNLAQGILDRGSEFCHSFLTVNDCSKSQSYLYLVNDNEGKDLTLLSQREAPELAELVKTA